MSVHYAFIKNNRVEDIYTFAAEDQKTANDVIATFGYDSAVFVGDNIPAKHASYDGTTFTAPTLDYLYSIGVSNENQEMHDARVAAEDAAKAAEKTTPTA